jgi:hypothetical protein
VRLASSLLEHIDNHPDLELCVPFSVLAETVFKTITTEKESKDPQKLEQISVLIELWRKLEIRFLLPSDEAAEICWNLVGECQGRMQPTDRTHLGYSLAYGMDFLITTDAGPAVRSDGGGDRDCAEGEQVVLYSFPAFRIRAIKWR